MECLSCFPQTALQNAYSNLTTNVCSTVWPLIQNGCPAAASFPRTSTYASLWWLGASGQGQGLSYGLPTIGQLTAQHLLVHVEQQTHVAMSGLPGDFEGRAAILQRRRKKFNTVAGRGPDLILTTSWTSESQSCCDNKCLTMSTRPCSAAHISAVLPSSS